MTPGAAEYELSARWQLLCDIYLPLKATGTFWRLSRPTKPREPSQGWKLHISATILEACDLFERVAPFLTSRDVRFKAPGSLADLINLNSGLKYGFWQVGKFLTVYPSTDAEAVGLARELHELTREFTPVAVPFDKRFLPGSSVFYRYGAFERVEMKNADGAILPAVRNLSGELVYDDCLKAVPEWLGDPFSKPAESAERDSTDEVTPLVTTYKVFSAVRQRGKGGTYRALDLSAAPPRFCIVKEGRRHGEVFWNGQDGFQLVCHEARVLGHLGKIYAGAPQFISSFEAHGNFYLVMEFVEGASLSSLMKRRRRRFSVRRILAFGAEIARIIEEIHRAGWVWNDCKPSNLIVTKDRRLRPIDFEGAYPIGQSAPFNWKSRRFSKPGKERPSSATDDLYALGAVLYFLLTGKFYDPGAPAAIGKFRRRVPRRLEKIISGLLNAHDLKENPAASEIRRQFEKELNLL